MADVRTLDPKPTTTDFISPPISLEETALVPVQRAEVVHLPLQTSTSPVESYPVLVYRHFDPADFIYGGLLFVFLLIICSILAIVLGWVSAIVELVAPVFAAVYSLIGLVGSVLLGAVFVAGLVYLANRLSIPGFSPKSSVGPVEVLSQSASPVGAKSREAKSRSVVYEAVDNSRSNLDPKTRRWLGVLRDPKSKQTTHEFWDVDDESRMCATMHWMHLEDPDGKGSKFFKRDPHREYSTMKSHYGTGFVKKVERMNDSGDSLPKIADWAEKRLGG